jgi:YidC/Oxa1 family membrane protein insertase
MDRRTTLAMLLCMLILLGWQKFFIEPRMAPQVSTQPTEAATQNEKQPAQAVAAASATQPLLAPTAQPRMVRTLALQGANGQIILSDDGSFLSDWILKDYKQGMAKDAAQVDVRSLTHQVGQLKLAFDDTSLAYLSEVQGKLQATPQGAIWTYEDSNVKLLREFIVSPQTTYLDAKITAEFKTRSPRFAFVSLVSQGTGQDQEAQDQQLLYWHQAVERVPLKDSIEQKQIAAPVKFIAATSRYFILAAVDQSPVAPNALQQPAGNKTGRMSLVYPVTSQSIQVPLRIYFGPKELEALRQVDPTLDHAIDFGWFTVCAYPLLKLLKWLYQFVQNYGISIILLTLLLKMITFPLNYKSMKNMKNMAKLQPQLQRIKERYKDDREALNREMLLLMKNHGYNPMAGCLPILIQMPIFFALYRVLYSSIELYHAPFGFWIHDLSSRDPLYITPVLLSLTMFIQQKLTPNTATDPAQAKMMQLMPLIFGAFMIALPSGLTLYMLVNALASIGQQLFLNKKLDIKPA